MGDTDRVILAGDRDTDRKGRAQTRQERSECEATIVPILYSKLTLFCRPVGVFVVQGDRVSAYRQLCHQLRIERELPKQAVALKPSRGDSYFGSGASDTRDTTSAPQEIDVFEIWER